MGDADERSFAEETAAGLWRRLRDMILVAERLETYAFAEAAVPDAPGVLPAGDAAAVSTDLVVRALRAAGDPDGWRILTLLAGREEGVPVPEIAGALGLPRLAVVERLAELVQAGLAARALDADTAHPTQAADAVVGFVRAVAAGLAGRAAAWAERKGSGDGLPLL